jgi:uncharacterized protein YggE
MRVWDVMAAAVALGAGLVVQSEAVQAELRRADEPLLVVSGEAEVSAAPDRASVGLGATAQAATAQEAQREVSATVARALDALRTAGVADEDMQTSGLSLHPVYSDPGPRTPGGEPAEPRIVAWRASNVLRVTTADPAALGGVIDAGIGAGANELQGIAFELADDTAQRAAALRDAVRNARTKAAALADAAGVALVALQRIEEGGARTQEPPHFARAMSFDASTPVQPGQVRVRASVTLVYRVAPRDDAPEPR